MELPAIVGFAAVALVVVGWLVISFSEPGPKREIVEWLSASALYLSLLMLFTWLLRKAIATDSMAGMIGFGFLLALFGMGLCVSLYHALRSGRRASTPASSATN